MTGRRYPPYHVVYFTSGDGLAVEVVNVLGDRLSETYLLDDRMARIDGSAWDVPEPDRLPENAGVHDRVSACKAFVATVADKWGLPAFEPFIVEEDGELDCEIGYALRMAIHGRKVGNSTPSPSP